MTVTSDGDRVVLDVKDDGCGFDPTASYVGRLGLDSMRSRAVKIGADIRVDSGPGRGTLVRIEIPLAPPNADLAAARSRRRGTPARPTCVRPRPM